MISEETFEVLRDIVNNHDRPDKISVALNPLNRDVTITIEHLDVQWFSELTEAART